MDQTFTDSARNSMVTANRLTKEFNTTFVGSVHIVLAILDNDESIRSLFAKESGTTDFRNYARDSLQFDRAGHVKAILVKTLHDAQSSGCRVVGTKHFMIAALTDPDAAVLHFLSLAGLTAEAARSAIAQLPP
ncbi:MAG: hypothetical protein JWN70_696 [Planctomycetaceae bacterium]|nr:hypothetical protein [Planctomycetaceae bacterium]